MKKLLAFQLAAILCFSLLIGCSHTDEDIQAKLISFYRMQKTNKEILPPEDLMMARFIL